MRRRGKNLLLSPLDWALIEAWKERGVPLHIVLRAIETVFDAAATRDDTAPRKRPIKSLLYCRDEVETQYAAWLETQVGNRKNVESKTSEIDESENLAGSNNVSELKPSVALVENDSTFSAEQILQHLKGLQNHFRGQNEHLNGSWQNLSNRVLIRLKEAEKNFAATKNAEQLESVLSELDHKIDGILNKIFESERFAQIEKETHAQLRAYKRQMPSEVFAETYQTLLIKNLRAAADLPRFSLFYL